MREKGRTKETNPEKMPVITSGIEMSRGQCPQRKEKLTGGNQPADETGVAKLVCDFIRSSE
jgi:hypothetical protein